MSSGSPPSGFPTRGARVQAARTGRPHELLLETYEAGLGLRRWVISADPTQARWVESFGAAKRLEPAEPPKEEPFVLLVRARLEGARVTAFQQADAPGSIELADARPAPTVTLSVESAEGELHLALELHRPHPNLFLLDGAGRVLGMMRPQAKLRPIAVGQPLPPLPVPRGFEGDPPRVPAPTPQDAQALDRAWCELLDAHDVQRMRAEGARIAKQAAARLDKRLAHLAQDREAAAQAAQYERWGELLKIHGYRWRPGMAELRVPDEFAEARPEVTIVLDPALTLAENIAALFRQYRKRQGAEAHVERRIAEARRDLGRIHEAADALARASTPEEAERALGKLVAFGGRKQSSSPVPQHPSSTSRPQPRSQPRSQGPMERISSDGFAILVGRSAEQNDELTFRIANGRDWWMHALGFPGSHVVVRNPSGGPLPPATLREAAWLAGYFSKARAQREVEVGYVERKHVRRVPKGKPGQVTYAHGKTLWIELGDPRLRKVLGATEDGGETNPSDIE